MRNLVIASDALHKLHSWEKKNAEKFNAGIECVELNYMQQIKALYANSHLYYFLAFCFYSINDVLPFPLLQIFKNRA